MIKADGVLAIVAARGGSKGLPRKNVLRLGGKPLIAWTIEAALKASCVSRVVVTTDDDEITDVARAAGADVPFRRPAELASDTATSADVVAHVVEMLPGYKDAVLLQPTSPFRSAADLDAGYELWKNTGAPGCVSVCEAAESPWLMYGTSATSRLERLLPVPEKGLRRQELPRALVLNGAFYFVDTERFMTDQSFLAEGAVGFEMPVSRSVDIDTENDFEDAARRLKAWDGRVPEETP